MAPPVKLGFWKTAGNIASAVLGLGQAGAGLGTQIHQNRKQREHERAMAEYAYNKDLEMWNRANEYNTPQAQMERFKEADLNPNMIYGSKTGVTGNTVASMPKYTPPRQNYSVQFPNVAANIQAYQNLDLRQAQIDNIKANTDKTNEQAALTAWKKEIAEQERRYAPMFYFNRSKLMNVNANIRGYEESRLLKTIDKEIEAINSLNEFKKWSNEAKKNGLNFEQDPFAARFAYITAIRQKTDPYNWMMSYAIYQEAATWIKSVLGSKGLPGVLNKQKGKSQNTIQKKYNPNKFANDPVADRIKSWNAQRGSGR